MNHNHKIFVHYESIHIWNTLKKKKKHCTTIFLTLYSDEMTIKTNENLMGNLNHHDNIITIHFGVNCDLYTFR